MLVGVLHLSKNGSYGTIGFLKELPVELQTVVYAGSETVAIQPSADANIPIPDDVVYLYVFMETGTGGERCPKSITLKKKVIDFVIE